MNGKKTVKNNDLAQNLLLFSISFCVLIHRLKLNMRIESTSSQLQYLQLFLLLFNFISVIFVILFFIGKIFLLLDFSKTSAGFRFRLLILVKPTSTDIESPTEKKLPLISKAKFYQSV